MADIYNGDNLQLSHAQCQAACLHAECPFLTNNHLAPTRITKEPGFDKLDPSFGAYYCAAANPLLMQLGGKLPGIKLSKNSLQYAFEKPFYRPAMHCLIPQQFRNLDSGEQIPTAEFRVLIKDDSQFFSVVSFLTSTFTHSGITLAMGLNNEECLRRVRVSLIRGGK
jgi:hypothetical protein